MDRKKFFKTAGAISIASLLPLNKTKAVISKLAKAELEGGGCVLIPSETAGPYPIDLSGDDTYFRQNITDDYPGTPLNLTLTIVNINDNCNPVPNARVDVWHCNKDGYYSGFTNSGYLGVQDNTDKRFCRGIQLTDSNGQVFFTTIYPGWYPGRVGHIHFQVYLTPILSATSQMAFPESMNTLVNTTDPLYSVHGDNATKNTSDGVFSDTANTAYELLTVVANDSGGYDASLTVGIDAPVTGIINIDAETGGQLKSLMNYPNPFTDETTISFTLTNAADVKIELFNLQGKKVMELINTSMAAGDQKVLFTKQQAARLAQGNYLYQLTLQNSNGTYRQCKLLTMN